MKKLYKVTMELMVMAENEEDAHYVATDPGVEIPEEDCEIENAVDEGCPEAWADAIPYGSDDDKTCKEVLKDERGDDLY